MKHLLVLSAFLVLSTASVISKVPSCYKAVGGATACHNMNPTWTFDHEARQCTEVSRGGCLNSANIFGSIEECQKLCEQGEASVKTDERPEFCNHGKAWGGATSCHNPSPSWTYDNTVEACVEILRGGCLNAENIFATEDECMAVCGSSEVAVISSDARIDVLNFNSFMDKVFGTISSAMKAVGADPIDVDGFVLDQIPNLKIGFKNFTLSGLSNIVRVGDWGFDVDGITKYGVHGGLGVHDVKGQITAVGEYSGNGGEVTVTTSMNKFDVTFKFLADISKCTIGLVEFTLGEGTEFDIDLDTGSFLDPVYSKTVTEITNYLSSTFDKTVEKAALLALGSVNVCELVASLVG